MPFKIFKNPDLDITTLIWQERKLKLQNVVTGLRLSMNI